jgi:hypothetical protein
LQIVCLPYDVCTQIVLPCCSALDPYTNQTLFTSFPTGNIHPLVFHAVLMTACVMLCNYLNSEMYFSSNHCYDVNINNFHGPWIIFQWAIFLLWHWFPVWQLFIHTFLIKPVCVLCGLISQRPNSCWRMVWVIGQWCDWQVQNPVGTGSARDHSPQTSTMT